MNDCIEWWGPRFRGGYGRTASRVLDNSKIAHRVAWIEVNGPVPEGLLVLHSCDNPPCVNVEHLFLGTNQDNTDDMLAKGRGRWGKATHGGRGLYVKGCRCAACVSHNRKRSREDMRKMAERRRNHD